MLLALAPLLAGAVATAGASGGPDTSRWRAELGVGSEITNEIFYEDAFVDSTILGRRLVDAPETRLAGLWSLSGEGTRGAGSTRWGAGADLSAGNLLQRARLHGTWRSEPTPEWRWTFAPQLEYRHDRTLDRDLDEWRGHVAGRVRREFLGAFQTLEAGLSGDFLRASGSGANYLLDRNSGAVSAGYGWSPPGGADLWIGAASTARVFPDSATRDHWEHRGEVRARWDVEGGHWIAIELEASRRTTRHLAPTSRDNFDEGRAAADLVWGAGGSRGARARLELDAMRYDVEDSTLYFDYHVVRAAAGPSLFMDPGWSVWVAVRGEALEARLAPGEAYRELGGLLEVERAVGGGWWSVAPAAGRREYRSDPEVAALGLEQLHASYAFAEISLMLDQPLPGALRARAYGQGRLERHDDASQDAGSLYLSVELRKLF